MKKVLLLLIFNILYAEVRTYNFVQLTNLVANATNQNIYLDANITNIETTFNLVKYQNQSEIYELYKMILKSNDLLLNYNKKGKFYYISKSRDNQIKSYLYNVGYIDTLDIKEILELFDIKYKLLYNNTKISYVTSIKIHKQIKFLLDKAQVEIAF